MSTPPAFQAVGHKPPVFKINLSQPPAERYVSLARLYRDKMRSMVGMFDELIESISPKIPVKPVHWLARLFLRRLFTAEETNEIRGISRATGVDLYLLVSLNVVLDLLMGCTSGGVRAQAGSQTKMLHFRTLDWGMDPLRDLIVQLEFIRDPDPEIVLATSITYVGFVGVLTGVKKELSASLNFRPVHDPKRNGAFYFNHLLVLLGFRQSISSLLRQCILPASSSTAARARGPRTATLGDVVGNVPGRPTTAAYLVFSDGASTVTMEKDHRTAVVCSSTSFIVTTNHDQQPDSAPTEAVAEDKRRQHVSLNLMGSEGLGMADIIEDSNERLDCIQGRWDRKVQQQNAQARTQPAREDERPDQPQETHPAPQLEQSKEGPEAEKEQTSPHGSSDASDVSVTQQETIEWLTTYPILNETTHYAAIMDPSEGNIAWVEWYEPADGSK